MKTARLIFLTAWAVSNWGAGLWAAWQPTDTIECVVPAGQGGGADQMIRFIAQLIEKHKLCPQKLVIVNKPGGSGAEGYLYVLGKSGDAHTLLITLSNLFTLPVAMGAHFEWNELTPIARLALDEFVLWVQADSPYKTVEDYLNAARSAKPGTFKMGGTGAAQEDQIITVMIEEAAKVRFNYIPMGGGGSVAQALAEKKLDSTVNNPGEIAKYWKEGKVRPLAVLDSKRLNLNGWKDIPTMKERGYSLEYLMMRSLFGPPSMSKEALAYYTGLLEKVYKSEEFQEYIKANAMKEAWLSGSEFHKWLETQDKMHKSLLSAVGLK